MAAQHVAADLAQRLGSHGKLASRTSVVCCKSRFTRAHSSDKGASIANGTVLGICSLISNTIAGPSNDGAPPGAARWSASQRQTAPIAMTAADAADAVNQYETGARRGCPRRADSRTALMMESCNGVADGGG